MPALAAPAFLFGAALAASVVVALHLLAWRRPAPRPLPTARFVPASSARAASRAVQWRDVALMCVRVAALLLAGLAMARPSWTAARQGVARVIVLDAARRVASAREVEDSARAAAAGATTVVRVRVDSSARLLPDSTLGIVAPVRGVLGAGLIVATREARRLARTHERVELVVISPFAVESWDASMDAVRARWDGAVRTMRVAVRGDTAAAAARDADAGDAALASGAAIVATDPVGAALALALPSQPRAPREAPLAARVRAVRVARDAVTAADSAAARRGIVVIAWARATVADSAFAVRALTLGERATIGRFASSGTLPLGNIIARWGDGTPAAVETPLGAGCIRTIAVALPTSGDAALSPSLRAALRELAAPCGGGSFALVDSARLEAWASPRAANAAGDVSTRRDSAPPLEHERDAQRWLLAFVALLLAVEWWMRRARAARAEAEPRPAAEVPEAA